MTEYLDRLSRRVSLRAALSSRSVPLVDLQWFAAEDEGRTEDPTEHKLRKAREEGKVAKSHELVSAIVLLFPLATIIALSGSLINTMLEMLSQFLTRSTDLDLLESGMVYRLFMDYFLKLTLPIAAVAVIAAILGNILQTGFLFSVKPITPDIEKILPRFGRFFKRAMFSKEAAFNLFKSLIKIVIIGAVTFLNIQGSFGRLSRMAQTPFLQSVSEIGGICIRISVESAIVLLLLSIPDYMFQRRQHLESLKMSKQEVKEERKLYDGDPLVKSRLRERMREIMTRNMIRNVQKADVVVTNPTHLAVAMEWKRDRMAAPTVVAKGADNLAQRIRQVAAEYEVPIIENKPFARALYDEVEIGDEIPEKYYEIMATILAQVYRLRGRTAKAV